MSPKPKSTVVGYIRVSTDEQADGGASLAVQEDKVRKYCELHDLTLVKVVVERGASAKTLDRPGLAEALGMLDSGEAEGLVITKLDRLSRNVGDWNTLIDRYFGERAGKELFSVADSIDTTTAGGRLVLNVLMSVAQWERETISERTRDALRHKKEKGERTGEVPYGKRVDPADSKRLVADETEQAVIARIKALRAGKSSYQAIVDTLNREGVKPRSGGRWHATQVRRILTA